MDTSRHTLSTLFKQLGLPCDDASIQEFIRSHSPLSPGVSLHEAPFWTESQSRFLEEGLEEDSDWAEIIDELDTLMRD